MDLRKEYFVNNGTLCNEEGMFYEEYVTWLENKLEQLENASSDNEYEGCSRCGNIIFQENMNTKICTMCGKVKGE